MVIRGATGSKCYRLPPSEKENSEVRDKKLIPLSSLKTLVHVNVKGTWHTWNIFCDFLLRF